MRGLVAAGAALLLALTASGCADPFFEATTVLGDTHDVQGPYVVQTVAVGVEKSDRVQLYFSVDDDSPDAFIPLLMESADDDDRVYDGERFSSRIPGQRPGSEILYYVAVERGGQQVALDPVGGDLRPFVFRVLP